MAFLGFMTVREHDRIVARADAVIDSATFHLAGEEYNEGRTLPQKVAIAVKRLAEARSNAFKNRQRYLTVEAKLVELAAELATLKAERDDCQAQKDEGATYVLKSLADALHVEDWSIKDGSEEWEGDVWATMFSILVDAGVVDEDHHNVATHAKIIGLERAISSLTPDALKYRERLRRDREALAAKRKRAVAALPKAQAARGGDVREGV